MAVAKKTTARKSTPKKSTARKTAARKSPAKKTTARKSTAKKSTARKTAARKTTARKTTASATFAESPAAFDTAIERAALVVHGQPAWNPQARASLVTAVAGGGRRAAELLDVDPAQTSRWAAGTAVPGAEHARVLVDLDHVMAHALLLWADEDEVRDWLNTPNAHLDGVEPIRWIRHDGTTEVINALRAEAAGGIA